MPNHVTTIIEADKEVLDALWTHDPIEVEDVSIPDGLDEIDEARIRASNARVRDRAEDVASHGYVDFGRLIPQPPNIEKGGCSGTHPPGVVCWYAWNTTYWGTKWNAYEAERRSDTELKFETAWSHPEPVIQALIERFPKGSIHVRYADEDMGYNLGEYTVEDGRRWDRDLPPGSDKAIEFASWLLFNKSFEDLKAENPEDWEDA